MDGCTYIDIFFSKYSVLSNTTSDQMFYVLRTQASHARQIVVQLPTSMYAAHKGQWMTWSPQQTGRVCVPLDRVLFANVIMFQKPLRMNAQFLWRKILRYHKSSMSSYSHVRIKKRFVCMHEECSHEIIILAITLYGSES